MIQIIKATEKDVPLLLQIGIPSFLAAHGHSASKEDIDAYVSKNFTTENFKSQLATKAYDFYLLYYKGEIAGYSKIISNSENEAVVHKNTTKLERLYFLEKFYGLGLAKELLHFVVNKAKENQQKGMWLYVWVENFRALSFYKKTGFVKVGEYDFVISPNKINPNYILYLAF